VRLTRYLARVRLRHLLTVLRVTLYFRAAVSITWIFKIALLRSPCRQDRHANPELCITCFFLRLLSYFCDTVIVLRLILVTISFNLCEYISYSYESHSSRNAFRKNANCGFVTFSRYLTLMTRILLRLRTTFEYRRIFGVPEWERPLLKLYKFIKANPSTVSRFSTSIEFLE